MEDAFDLLVLMVDAIPGVSAAACQLPELDTVLINRQEIVGRRHYDLAHELFHILTWDTMPPAHVEAPVESGGNHIEQLANNFASALLMPAATLAPFGTWSDLNSSSLVRKLNQTADEFAVTASALKWRLVATGQLSAATARKSTMRCCATTAVNPARMMRRSSFREGGLDSPKMTSPR